jgi:hypothetical protein
MERLSIERYPRPVSNSEIGQFKRCRRQWWLGTYRGLRPRKADWTGARRLGDKIHTVLAEVYSPTSPIKTVDDALGIWDEFILDELRVVPELEHELKKDHDLGRAMLEGYFQWLEETGADADWEVVDSEKEVSLPFVGYHGPRPVVLVGKKDLTIRKRSDGSRSFVDHKTVQNFTDIPKTAHLNEQFKHYSLLDYLEHLAQEGDPERATFVDGGIFNMLRKVKRTASAKPPFFDRHEVRHNVHQLRAYWHRLAGEVTEIQRAEDRLAAGENHLAVAYPSPTRDCSWDCDFFAVCHMLDDETAYAEAFLADAYEPGDPYARYQKGRTDGVTTDA